MKRKTWKKRVLAFTAGISMVVSMLPVNISRAADTESVYAAAYQNASGRQDTSLPEKVLVGGKQEIVTWDIRSSKFAVPYETVAVNGTTESGASVTAKVEVIPEAAQPLVYFVDAGREGQESKAFDAVKSLAGGSLKNTEADQICSGTAAWGRKSTYHVKGTGGLDVTDKYQTGVYGENDRVNSISWQFDLEAGEYTLHAGFLEWWSNSRTMQIEVNGASSEKITLSGANMERKTGSVSFQVSGDGPVTVDIKNPTGGQAPVVSWLAVAKGKVTVPQIGQETEIVVKGSDVEAAAKNVNGLTYKGFGMLSGNSTSDLLMDYKQEAPEKYEELLQVLFGGEHPLMNHVKMEMGNDGNNSTGADSCTMRFEDEEADASRSPGFQLAADAKKINPKVKVSFLRWTMPAWVQEKWDGDRKGAGYEAMYKWYRETIFDAYEKYGYVVDYVDPDTNETQNPDADFIKWFKQRVANETEFPSYMDDAARDAYRKIRIIASDENTTLNIVPKMRSDAELYQAVDAVGFHYSTGTQSSTADYRTMADKDDKEIWYSEGCAVFSYTEYQENKNSETYGANSIGGYQSPLALTDNFIASFIYSRKTHYIFQPAVGSFYEGAQYDHKELISAREPWAGYIHYDPSVYMLQHFSKFAKTGWENSENTEGIWRVIANASGNASGNRGDLGHITNESGKPSYMTLAAPDRTAFSVVIVNNSEKTLPYAVKAEDMKLPEGTAMEIWETKKDSYMQYRGEAGQEDGYYILDVEPYSMVTVTTLDCDGKQEYTQRLPEENDKAVLDTDAEGKGQNLADKVLYADDFEYSSYPEDYLEKRGNEPRYAVDFTGAFTVESGKLKQLLSTSVNQWNHYEPNTVIGDFRWMNYKAGVDVQPGAGSYAGLNIRQQTGMGFEGSGYNLRITEDGTWTLKKRGTTITTGKAEKSADGIYRLELEGRGSFISAWVDGVQVACYNDPEPEYFGRVRLGCGWAETTYDNLKVETVDGYEAYALEMIDNASDEVTYEGSWSILAGAGGSNNDWYRSTSTASEAGASFQFTMNGGGFALIGENDGSAVLDVEVDGVKAAEGAAVQRSEKHGAAYIQYGLADGTHRIKITVKSGRFVLDAVMFLPYQEGEKIVGAEEIYGAAYEGEIPVLPETVTCTKSNGEGVAEKVVWNLENLDLKAYETAYVFGTTETSGTPVSAKVEVIPPKAHALVYYLDASRDEGKESLAFRLVSALSGDTLKNKAADQEYTEASGWGRTGNNFREKTTSNVDIKDKYQTGWYSSTKTDWLTYQMKLEAGDYELTAGFHEWWNNRSMKISVSGTSVDKVTSDAISVSGIGDNARGTVAFTVKEDSIVKLEIENATGGEAPVLSWFGVAKMEEEKPAPDKSGLEEAVNRYKDGIDGSIYTEASYQVFIQALQKAQEVLADEKATEEEIVGALEGLEKACEGLEEKPALDKSGLEEAVNKYKDSVDGSQYTEASYQAFAQALQKAQEVFADEKATEEEIAAALDALEKAHAGLEEKPAPDKSGLEEAVNKYKDSVDGSQYTEASYQAFAQALQKARKVLADEKATEEEIAAALDALEKAHAGLEEKPAPDKGGLEEAVNKYKDSVDGSQYTEASYQTFAQALQKAQEVFADERATEDEIAAALDALEKAYAGLAKKPVEQEKPTALAAPSIASVKSSAAKTGSEVTVRVNPVANAASYTVYRKAGGKVTEVGSAANGIVKDRKPVSGKAASYYAVAKSSNAKYTDSVPGEAKAITLSKDTAKLKVKKSGKTVRVTFKKVKGAKGYLIYRAAKKNGTYTRLTKKPVKKLVYTDKKVKKGKTYYYKVVVYGKNKTYSAGKVSKKIKFR